MTVVINDPTDNTDVTASPGSLTFTPTDWKNGKTVTVTTVLDHDTDTETATITHTVSGGDYAAVTAKDVDVTITDGCDVLWCRRPGHGEGPQVHERVEGRQPG